MALDDSVTRWPVGVPVEPPPSFVAPDRGVRRHRPLLGLSGAVLAGCAFLPALERTDDYLVPIAAPAMLVPYLFGLPFVVLARSRTGRGLRAGTRMLRALAIAVVVSGLATMLWLHAIGIIEVLLGMVLAMTIGFHAPSERRAAATASLFGGLGSLWFGLWAMSANAMVGVFLALFASVGLLLAGLLWLGDQASPRVPRAVLSSSTWHERSSSS